MSYGKIVNLANNLAAAYKEIPYSALKVFLLEKTAQYPGDRVLQHMGAIIEKRAEQQPFGSVYVKDIDAMIGELSSFGSTDLTRGLFGSYLSGSAPESRGAQPFFREVYDETGRDLTDAKKASDISRTIVASGPEKINEIPINKILSDYKMSKSYDRKAIADGANIVNRIITATFGSVPTTITFESDTTNGMLYNATVVTANGRVDIQVPIEKGLFGFHAPAHFLAKDVKYAMTESSARSFVNETGAEKSASYDSSWLKATYAEIHASMLKCATDRDYRGAEEAIQIINQKYPTMSKNALNDYQGILMLFAKADNKHICTTCPFYEPAGEKTASVYDYCHKLRAPVSGIVKDVNHNCELVGAAAKKAVAGFEGTLNSSRVRFS
jgi:hypothetical protein